MDAPSFDLVPPRGDSTRAYRAAGSQPNGADLFAQLDHPGGAALDLSGYYGIGFWARLNGTDRDLVVALGAGGVSPANDPTSAPSVDLVAAGDWLAYELPFAEFGTDGSKVASIDFIVGRSGGTYDLWLNDLTLLCRGECPGSAGD
jgi:hypothetical protein